MKKLAFLAFLIPIFLGCEKENSEPELDLTGTFSGTYTGYSQPFQINGATTWEIIQVKDSVFADIVGGSFPDSFKGKVIGDTLINGSFRVSFGGMPGGSAVGTISNLGENLTIQTPSGDPAYNYFRIKYTLARKSN